MPANNIFRLAALLGAVCHLAGAALVPVQPRQGCSSDNCFRALNNKAREGSVYSFCTSLLSTSLPATATAGIPSYLANCGPSSFVSRLSSACPCFLATATYGSTTTTGTSTSTTSTSSTPTTSSESTTVSSTASSTADTCSGPAVTTTLTVSVTLPGATCTASASTTSLPGSTSTCSATTVTEPGPATTVTAPGTVVTTPGPTVTVTARPPARSCAQPVDDASFEGVGPGLYPWAFGKGGPGQGWPVGQDVVGAPGSRFPPGSGGRPRSGSVAVELVVTANGGAAAGDFIRLWQALNPCAGGGPYRPRLWYATDVRAAGGGTISFRVTIYTVSAGNPGAVPTLAYNSFRTVSAVTPSAWTEVIFDVWSSAAVVSAVMYLDIQSSVRDHILWLDDITLPSGTG